jgi:glycosyltransferase involved in cell wall biosynthesis
MHILFLHSDHAPPRKVTKELASLKKLGHIVSFLGWCRLNILPERKSDDFLYYSAIHLPCGYASWKIVPLLPIWLFLGLKHTSRMRPDVLHAADFEAALLAFIYSFISGKPFIYDILDTFYMRGKRPEFVRNLLKKIDGLIMKRARKIIVVDENRITEVEKPYLSKVSIIYNSPPDLGPFRSNGGPFTVLATGNLYLDRGIMQIIAVCKRIEGTRLLLAGTIREDQIWEAIKHHPFIDYRGLLSYKDALNLYAEADLVYAYYDPSTPIYINASSNKIFDAMMASRPVLINSEIRIVRLVADLDCGYTAPYGDIDEIERIIRTARDIPEISLAKALNGRMAYENEYSWELMEQRVKEVYSDLEAGVS